jgi:uncharacterized protein (UPF0333 family)
MKKVLYVVLALLILGSAVGYYLWNKAPAKVENQKATAITANELAQAFVNNEQKANASYLNKVMAVSGKVMEVSKNQDGKTVIILEAPFDPTSGVQCTMRDNQFNPKAGDNVTLKGFCNAYTIVVILSDCIPN